jgi:hypothetical protein
MLSGALMYVIGDAQSGIHKTLIIPAERIMASLRIDPSDRGLFVLHVLPTAFFVFEPVLVLLALGHDGTLQTRRVS